MSGKTINREFAETNIEFLDACKKVASNHIKDFKPSIRQASKWRQKKGIAWKMRSKNYKDYLEGDL